MKLFAPALHFWLKSSKECIFTEKEKSLKRFRFKDFRLGGISRARTYDLHDVNDKKTLILQQKMVGF